uniref:C-type lectin domain-containing protein n=1 Tax=Sphenodon punctatus TaxID=8508 RepID=A0A8D0GMJ7_SPHPU
MGHGEAPAEIELKEHLHRNGDAERGEEPDDQRNLAPRKLTARNIIIGVLAVGVVVVVAVVAVVVPSSVLLAKCDKQPPPARDPDCPDGWVGYQEKCYYYSTDERNWTSSQSNCSSFGASLARIDSEEEKAFVLRYKGKAPHWIGLQRDQDQPSKWADAGVFSSTTLQGEGDCGYLNSDSTASALECHVALNWICSKPKEKRASIY